MKGAEGVDMSYQCINECLKKGIKIVFYSTTGTYFGRIASSNHVNVLRQRKQAKFCDNQEFVL